MKYTRTFIKLLNRAITSNDIMDPFVNRRDRREEERQTVAMNGDTRTF